jgi:hypothetical protein
VIVEDFEKPQNYIAEVLSLKLALKLMHDNERMFDRFIAQFQIKFGRLQIGGHHMARLPYKVAPPV